MNAAQFEVIKYLVANGADVKAKDNDGQTAQDIAFHSGIWKCHYLKSFMKPIQCLELRKRCDRLLNIRQKYWNY